MVIQNGLRIRRYHPDDATAVVTLFRDTVHRVNNRDYSPDQVQAWAPDEIDVEEWTRKLARSHTVVATLEERIVGFGNLESNGHIDQLYVHADYQGRGVGGAVVDALEEEARRLGFQRLRTEASITAKPFFERHGYSPLQEQMVEQRGVQFIDYRMEKDLT